MYQKTINFKSGMTMMELLVGITLAASIFLGATTLIVSLFSSASRTKQLDELAQSRNDLQAELSNAVRWATSVTTTATTIEVTIPATPVDKIFLYEFDALGERILKSEPPGAGVSFTGDRVRITSMNVLDYSVSPTLASLDVTIELEHATLATVKDAFHIVVSQRGLVAAVN